MLCFLWPPWSSGAPSANEARARKARGTDPPRPPQGQGRPFGGPPESSEWARVAAGCAAADLGERFFGYFLVATRKYLAFGCENPIRILAV